MSFTIETPHVIELEHHGDNGCRVICRRCGLLGDVHERIAGNLIARHRWQMFPRFRR